MAHDDDDDDLKLVKASAGLLAELQECLPRLLRTKSGRVHASIRAADLDKIVNLIEPFQSEPQLLDASLKTILPPIVDAYLEFLVQKPSAKGKSTFGLQDAVSVLLYVLCKVRGYKIVVGFLSNEPKYLEPILEALERALANPQQQTTWQAKYVLLLWLSHLLLVPFDLESISSKPAPANHTFELWNNLGRDLPPLVSRVLRVGLRCLSASTKAQDAAAILIVRLSIRPDVQRYRLGDALVRHHLACLRKDDAQIYEQIGGMRLIAGASNATELAHLIPDIYSACQRVFDEPNDLPIAANAVGKKLAVKTFRNIALLSLKSAAIGGSLLEFVESSGVLEGVIDYSLRSLGDKDTPVRHAAAKAVSLIVLQLDPLMGHEVIQAVLDTFKEDIPRSVGTVDYATVDPLKWHGLTLALAHALFKRSASPEQLSDLLRALFSALQFHQRTATGTSLGTNVRDAANFGIWSMARRYTTRELLSVKAAASGHSGTELSIIQQLAMQLILSSCLDPAGNIRRGSSAALQELVGRHPDEIFSGIALVQIIDYLAVGLRRRAMIEVAARAAALHPAYWRALVDGLLDWRGLGSADVSSRESAAVSIAALWAIQPDSDSMDIVGQVLRELHGLPKSDTNALHGHLHVLANIVEESIRGTKARPVDLNALWEVLAVIEPAVGEITPRALRSELSAAVMHFMKSMCGIASSPSGGGAPTSIPWDTMNTITERLLARREPPIVALIPDLVRTQFSLSSKVGMKIHALALESLVGSVGIDSTKDSLHGAGRVIALGALALHFQTPEERQAAITCVCQTLAAPFVDWRIIGAKALQLAIEHAAKAVQASQQLLDLICPAVHSGLNNYTIDERGDIGSLVRLQSIECVKALYESKLLAEDAVLKSMLDGDIYRLSLEKLDRVRFQAARCRQEFLDLDFNCADVASVSSGLYLHQALRPLAGAAAPAWQHISLLAGCISCAGISADSLMESSRRALALHLHRSSDSQLEQLASHLSAIMKSLLTENPSSLHPALELLSFLLDMNLLDRLHSSTTFKWRNLLATVQQAHHKSADIPRIVAAVQAYVELARVPVLRVDVLKKLVGMLRTNPYPRVRFAVAEALWVATGDEELRMHDPSVPPAKSAAVLDKLKERYT